MAKWVSLRGRAQPKLCFRKHNSIMILNFRTMACLTAAAMTCVENH